MRGAALAGNPRARRVSCRSPAPRACHTGMTEQQHLDNLPPDFSRKVRYILARMRDLGYDAVIAESLRSKEQQKANVAKGVSWTTRSKHLKQKDGYAHAVDIVSKAKGWNASPDFWFTLGRLALTKGLRWGGLWFLPASQRRRLVAFLTDLTLKPWEPWKWRDGAGIRDPRTGIVHLRGRDPAHVEWSE